MNINNFSRTERAGGAIGSTFKFLFGWVTKINFLSIIITVGLLGWIFGLYMDFVPSLKSLGAIFLGVLFTGLFMVEDIEDHLGTWFTFWFVVFGFIGYYVKGNVPVTTTVDTNKVYMVEAVLNGSQIEYMGGDKMTKIIKIGNAEILAHYRKFKDSDRFKSVLNTRTVKNVILTFVGIDYTVKEQKWITLNDKVANKTLFTIN